jgi:hypothetical protein
LIFVCDIDMPPTLILSSYAKSLQRGGAHCAIGTLLEREISKELVKSSKTS